MVFMGEYLLFFFSFQEGIAVTGDPEFDLFASSYPYAFKRAVSVFGMKNLSEIAKEAAIARLAMD